MFSNASFVGVNEAGNDIVLLQLHTLAIHSFVS